MLWDISVVFINTNVCIFLTKYKVLKDFWSSEQHSRLGYCTMLWVISAIFTRHKSMHIFNKA